LFFSKDKNINKKINNKINNFKNELSYYDLNLKDYLNNCKINSITLELGDTISYKDNNGFVFCGVSRDCLLEFFSISENKFYFLKPEDILFIF